MTAITASLTGQTSNALAAGGPAAGSTAQGFSSVFNGLFAEPQAQPAGVGADPTGAQPTALVEQLTAALARLTPAETPFGRLDSVSPRSTIAARSAEKPGAENQTPAIDQSAPVIAPTTIEAEAVITASGVGAPPPVAAAPAIGTVSTAMFSGVAPASAATVSAVQAQAAAPAGDVASAAGRAIPNPKPVIAASVSTPTDSGPDVPSPAEAAGASAAEDASIPGPGADKAVRTVKAPATPTAAQSPKAAIATDAAVTRLIGEIATETPKLEAPSVLAPPPVSGTQSEGADLESSAGDRSQTDAKPVAPAPAASLVDIDDGDVPAPDGTEPEIAAQRADGPAPPATERPTAAASHIQTAAAPATPAAHNPQAAAGATAAAAVQVATEIASHAGARRTRFEVRLDPGELGRVDVRLDIAHDGRLATRLIVERPETLDMLRNDARELTRTLEQAGFQLGQGGLAFQLKDGRQGDWRDDRSAASNTGAPVVPDQPAPANEIYRRAARSGGVDVTV